MSADRWLTNLESLERMERELEEATATGNKSAIALAKFKLADVKRAMALIEMENGGRISIGPPKGTIHRTAEAIAADGIIGIYRQGAGDGPASSIKEWAHYDINKGAPSGP